MEFREYRNLEERDYDINSSLSNNYSSNSQNIEDNQYIMQLLDLIGILEDINETELIENYGITMKEYFRPNAETIQKDSEKLNSKQIRRSR